MRSRNGWLALLVAAAGAVLAPAVQAQDYAPPDPVWPLPLYSDRPQEGGGFYTAGEFLYFCQTNPLDHQLIAVRGFFDSTGQLSGHQGGFIGSGAAALWADDAGGPKTFQPGFAIVGGWKFDNGVAVELNWWHLAEAKYAATASIEPPGLKAGADLSDTFVSSFVYNFPNEYAGPSNKVGVGPAYAAYGIWDAASIMTIMFVQRFDQWEASARIPVWQTDTTRSYGLFGPRLTWIWERFTWRTVSVDITGQAGPDDAAIYSNTISNRMYGLHAGFGHEWNWGTCPIGSFSCSLDLEAALFADIAKDRAKYERADRATAAQRVHQELRFSPEVEGHLNFWWYPIEGVMVRVGYNAMAFFNTEASPEPVSFNFGGLDPPWKDQFRLFHGLNFGVGLIF